MVNFEYYTPTKVVFGKGTQNRVGELAKAYGATKVLVHYGSGSVVRSGLLEQVLKSLDEAGVAHVELGGVVPNPRLSKVYEGIELCKKEGVDFLLGVGGGSVIDSCKAIGYGLCYDGDVWDIISQQVAPPPAPPSPAWSLWLLPAARCPTPVSSPRRRPARSALSTTTSPDPSLPF